MPPVLGFCGASGSGKTTLVSRLIGFLSQNGLAVGAIKHHGHPQPLEAAGQGKDSRRLASAGAELVAFCHGGGLELCAGAWAAGLGPAEIAGRFMEGLDLVLVEGFKRANLAKIEVLGPGKQPLWPGGGRLLALAAPGGEDVREYIDFSGAGPGVDPELLPILNRDQPEEVIIFITKYLGM